MKPIHAAILLALAAALPAQAQTPLGATDVTAQELHAFIDKLPRDATSDLPIRVIDVGGSQIGIYGAFRPAAAPDRAALHQTKVTEVYYILDGGGTIVTGGKLIEPVVTTKAMASAIMNTRSETGIDGGVTRHVGKGDIVVIPGGVPHYWSKRDGDLSYLIVRSDPKSELTLK